MRRLLALALLITPLICYLEWGGGNSTFLFKVEYDLLLSAFDKADAFMHPVILVPLCGQLLLLFVLFQKTPSLKLMLVGLILQAVLVVIILLCGILSLNPKTLLSTLPFLLSAIVFVRYYVKHRRTSSSTQ